MKRISTLFLTSAFRGVAIAVSLFVGSQVARAQTDNPPAGVAVRIYARGFSNQGGNLTISGTFMSAVPGQDDVPVSTTTSSSNSSTLTTILGGTQGYARVEPGKSYTLLVNGPNIASGELNIVAPPGYRVVLDQMIRSRRLFSGLTTATFELQPLGARHPGLAGMSSSTPSDEIEWRLSLGSLRNGGSAGELALIDNGMRADWGPIFTPARLYYEPTSDEIWVYRPNFSIRQIRANQVVVDIVTIDPTTYAIKCYHPAQERTQQIPNSDESTFVGEPFVTYRIERGTTTRTLRIVKEVRDIADLHATGVAVSRREVLTLSASGTWPNVTWTKTDWTLDGQTPLVETVTQSTSASGTLDRTSTSGVVHNLTRMETTEVRVPNSGGGPATAPAFKVARTYSAPLHTPTAPPMTPVTTIGEVLAAEDLGESGNGVGSDYEYYVDTSKPGSLGYIKWIKRPGGKWAAFEYYDSDLNTGSRGGHIKYIFEPFMNTGVTPSFTTGLGKRTYYQYVNNIFGVPARPSYIETIAANQYTSKTYFTYNDNLSTLYNQTIAETIRTDWIQSTNSGALQTTNRYFRDDSTDGFVRGQPTATIRPDGTMQSFSYQRGMWDGVTFTPGAGIGEGGNASRIASVLGARSYPGTGATQYTAYEGYTIDSLWLVDGKSSMEVTIRDSRALIVRTETHIWKAGSWRLVNWTSFTYDVAGHLTSRVTPNGTAYTATYVGGIKTSETDAAGVTINYACDVHGRVATVTRVGSGTIATIITKFTYNAAGQVSKEEVGYGQPGALTTERAFDTAGRITMKLPPGNYGAENYTYDSQNRVETTTRADGSTVITTDYLDGKTQSITGTGVVAAYHTYGVENDGRQWHKVDTGSSNSPRWSKVWKDWAGRLIREESPSFTGQPNLVKSYFYSGARLSRTQTTGYAQTVYEYDALGSVTRTGLDVNGNNTLDGNSNDRITETNSYLESYNGSWWKRIDNTTYPKLGLNTSMVTSISRTRMTDFPAGRLSETQAIDVEGNITTQMVDVNREAKTSIARTTRSGLPNAITETTLNGYLISTTSYDGLTVSRTYDSLLRPSTVTDSRGNISTTNYVTGTALVLAVTNAANNQTVTAYDNMGRVQTIRDPRNHYTRSAYNLRGQLSNQWGDGATPVSYSYDATYGDRTTMNTYRGGSGWDGHSWPTNPGAVDTTTWTYDAPSGLLSAKTDAKNKTVNQTYNVRRQTATRLLARNVASGPNAGQRLTTTYSYDGATGELLSRSYNDGTPSVYFTYGRTAQVETVIDDTGTRDLVYDASKPWRMVAEAHSSFYGGRVMTRLYDEAATVGRVRGFQLGAAAGNSSDLEQTLDFTTVGRLNAISSTRNQNILTSRTFRYGYLANSEMLESLSVEGNAFQVFRGYETQRDLVTSIDSKWSVGTLLTGYAYTYDERGQRNKSVQSGTAYSDYGDVTSRQFTYNARGELTAAIGFLGSDISQAYKQLPGRRYEYDYDAAGNRKSSNSTGVSALRDDYTTNELNQYVTRENNTLSVSGTAEPETQPPGPGGTAVAVAGSTLAAGRQGRYWNDNIALPNVLNPWRGPVTIFTAKRAATGGTDLIKMDSRMAEIAAVLQNFTYDLDGNLDSDGLVNYTWDAENRLVRMETSLSARNHNFPHRLIDFRYDYMGRRVQKRVADITLNQEISCRRYLYDGWNLIAEYLSAGGIACGALVRSYTWGLDIASSQSSAGGVGALLQIADHPTGMTYFPTYDGNGNVVSLVNASTGSVAAVYEYSSYGEPLRAQVLDAAISDNPFRFSTKFTDIETSLIYYGHRYYEPKNGRFINRDPIEESGGLNLFAFCRNNPINLWDILGREPSGTPAGAGASYEEVVIIDGIVYNRTWTAAGSGNEGDELHWEGPNDSAVGVLGPDGTIDFGAGSDNGNYSGPGFDNDNAGLIVDLPIATRLGRPIRLPTRPTNPFPRSTPRNPRPNRPILPLPGQQNLPTITSPSGPTAGGRGPGIQGNRGVEQAKRDLENMGYIILGEQVTIITSGSVRIRVDIVAARPGGQITLVEVKTGGSTLSINQRTGYGNVQVSGGVAVGSNADGVFTGPLGGNIGPMPVIVISYPTIGPGVSPPGVTHVPVISTVPTPTTPITVPGGIRVIPRPNPPQQSSK